MDITQALAQALGIQPQQVSAVIRLLDEGCTVPFIARYRKEATKNLSDTQLRELEVRLTQFRALAERRTSILAALREQGELTPALEQALMEAKTKARLEDLYLPYRPRRQNKATQAVEAGLEPLADALLSSENRAAPMDLAQAYINPEKGVETAEQALEGAKQILMVRFSEEADLLERLRQWVWDEAMLKSSLRAGDKSKKQEALKNKYQDYFAYEAAIKKIPSHRALALFRGRRESVLTLSLLLGDSERGISAIYKHFSLPTTPWIDETVRQAWKTKLWPKLELEAFARLKNLADDEAIRVFKRNLASLLLSAPAGPKVIMGLDPGIRTGIKVAVVDKTGKLLDYSVVHPFAPVLAKEEAIATLAKLLMRYEVELISIGNGTASRETCHLITELLKRYPDLACKRVLVNEAGASVYSASALASSEFPDLDVTIRGAVSIARRLQDPLAELVKIEPKAIGVGQYQHDINQTQLEQSLDTVVEDCVNAVGVDVNTASASLLCRIAGLNKALANHIVAHRDAHGAFKRREDLLQVARMGPKAFEQAAGFLRIKSAQNPLDATGIHPETYVLVDSMCKDLACSAQDLLGDASKLKQININHYVNDVHGLATLNDILNELEKPGLDPRPEFKQAEFRSDVSQLEDLKVDMLLDGVVSNVTNFGAFVDIGVHQDGLVHISELAPHFVKDPHALLTPGTLVRVKVIEVDTARRRIGLSMKLDAKKPEQARKAPQPQKTKPQKSTKEQTSRRSTQKPVSSKRPTNKMPINTAMADALAKWKRP